jgi:hypothetical protein
LDVLARESFRRHHPGKGLNLSVGKDSKLPRREEVPEDRELEVPNCSISAVFGVPEAVDRLNLVEHADPGRVGIDRLEAASMLRTEARTSMAMLSRKSVYARYARCRATCMRRTVTRSISRSRGIPIRTPTR